MSQAYACPSCGLDPEDTDKSRVLLYNQSLEFSPAQVANGNRTVEVLQRKISRIAEALERLTAVRLQMEQLLARQTNNLAPVNRLSDDLLLMIFQLATDRYVRPHHCLNISEVEGL
ncbi:hypothetical protein BDV98DRAFT_563257 [Pterulicium gracile]|uniref:Uncharacterized protein n=1 Tax=Pterulicium gracile TaxID=1884261 RepID=A0A5C3QPK6_9AGAR|nr:hypothetical protein BDV98DRAFT_563257 [Pterula gracilis]